MPIYDLFPLIAAWHNVKMTDINIKSKHLKIENKKSIYILKVSNIHYEGQRAFLVVIVKV